MLNGLRLLQLISLIMYMSNNMYSQNMPIRSEIPSENYSLYQWTTENGLPQNNVRQIIEADDGFLWLATFNGLVRFDGYEFRVYDEGNIPGLTSSFILNMTKSHDGVLWVSTENEVLKIVNNIPMLYLTETKGEISFASNGDGTYAKSKEAIYFLNEDKWEKVLDLNPFRNYHLINGQNRTLVQSDDSLFQINDNRLISILSAPNLRSLNDQHFISEKDGKLICYTYANDLIKIEHDESNCIWSAAPDLVPASSIYLDDKTLVKVFRDQLSIEINGEKQHFSNSSNLNLGRIEDVKITSSGIIWVGTNSTGLFMLYPKTFTNVLDQYNAVNNSGFMVFESSDSSIWFDQKCDGLASIQTDSSMKKIFTGNCAWTLSEDLKGNLWIGGSNTGIHKYEKSSSKLTFIPYKNDLNGKITFSLFTTKYGEIYLGTNEGVYRVVGDSLKEIEGSRSLGKIFSFYEDSENQLLACTNEGLVHFKENQINRIFTKKNGLPTNDIRSIYQDSSRNYWIGTSQFGLCFFDGFELVQLPFNDGRLNKNIWCIIEDESGYLWMNSNQGIYRANREELIRFAKEVDPGFSSKHFTKADGLANSEGNSRTQNRGFKANDGKIWFSMISGPAYVDPKEIDGLINNNKILFDKVLIDNEVVSVMSPIIVEPHQNQIQFEFSHPNFYQTQHLRYMYKIDGLDERWFEVGRSRLMTFSELPAGLFTLRIKQVGTEQEAEIDFEVKVNFWEKDSFKHALVFGSTAVVFFIVFFIWRSRRYGKAQLKRMGSELKSLELRALQSQMNPHFVFNCLSSIQSLYLLGESERANEYLSQFSSLLRVILEHAQKRLISLQEDLDMFKIYVPLEGLQFDDPFNFKLHVDENVNTETLFIPSMVTHTFIENAIKHGIKPLKNRKGELTILVSKSNKNVILKIQDNGVGYEKSQATKTASKRMHKSRGLDITNQRIDILNLLNDLDIHVETNNLTDSKGEAKGTEIILYFPIIENYEDFNR